MKIDQVRLLPEGSLKEALWEMCRCFHEDGDSWQWGHVEGRSLRTLGKTKLAELLQQISKEITEPRKVEEMVLVSKAQLGNLTSALLEANTLLDQVAAPRPGAITPWRKQVAQKVLEDYFVSPPEEPPVTPVLDTPPWEER